jgi:hypothetical protein
MKVFTALAKMLNTGEVPEYFCDGKLVPLFKHLPLTQAPA